MYFKERQHSALYKRQQHLEQERLVKKLEQIKTRKLKRADSENFLPLIINRTIHIKPHQLAMVEAETQRLSRKILELKTNRSQYFTKVIKLDLPSDRHKQARLQQGKTRLNRSLLLAKEQSNV